MLSPFFMLENHLPIYSFTSSVWIKNTEYQIILDILSSVGGNRKLTSEKLGISQRTLRYKLAKMRDSGIEVPTSYPTIAA